MRTGVDLGKRLATTRAVASVTVHLAVVLGDGPAVSPHTLCGRAVTEVCRRLGSGDVGCPGCALEAIAMGIDVVRVGDRVALRLEDLDLVF